MKNYQAGLNTLRNTSELGEPKLDKNCWGMCRALRPVHEFYKNIIKHVPKTLLK